MDARIDMELLIQVLAGCVVFLLALGLSGLLREHRRRRLVRSRFSGAAGITAAGSGTGAGLGERLCRAMAPLLAVMGKAVGPRGAQDQEESRLRLVQGGYRSPRAPQIFHGLRIAMAVGSTGLFLALYRLCFPLLGTLYVAVACLALALGSLYACDLWVKIMINTRQTAIRRGLPDALDLLVVCVEAGLAMDAALDRVGQEMRGKNRIVSEELKTVTLELRAGKHRQEALKNLAKRVGLEDLDGLVAVLVQTDAYGTSIAQALRVFSDDMRSKRYMRAEEKAAMLPVKITIPLVLFIFPAIFVAIMGSSVIKIMGMFNH